MHKDRTMSQQPESSLKTADDLPDTVLLKILSYLPSEYLVHFASRICSRWQTLCGDYSVWQGKEYVVTDIGITREDSEVACALQQCPGVRHVKFLRQVKPSVLQAVGFDGMLQTLVFHPAQQISTEVLHQLFERCPHIVALGVPSDVLKRSDCAQLVASLECLQQLAVKAENRAGLNLGVLSEGCPHITDVDAMEVVCNPVSLTSFLKKKGSQLHALSLCGMTTNGESVLPLLEPCHTNLKKLCITLEKARAKGFSSTLPLLGRFEAIVELKLLEVPGKVSNELTEAFSGNGLRHLKSACFRDMHGLRGASLAALLRDRPELQHLDISGCMQIEDSDLVIALSATEPDPLPLLSINLSSCGKLTDTSLIEVVQRCPKLQELHLCACLTLKEKALHPVAGLTDLRVLDVSRCYNIKEWWKPLLELHQLRWINVSYLTVVPDRLEQIIKQNKFLRYIGLQFCNGFDEITCERVLKANPQLELNYDTEYIKQKWQQPNELTLSLLD
ncbi:dynein regulatory complex subunit 6-like isoform X2 [Schistocerca nitens]|uniref:dynein regulatory complex subunit 6-like isoform X2 n=1 Tax=Schistocerca nitens TaxID=7011 RepID=UPI0021197E4D|nr:dynein regulatory complex subunit 6-like isoform X2 [Schistocerca nitens]